MIRPMTLRLSNFAPDQELILSGGFGAPAIDAVDLGFLKSVAKGIKKGVKATGKGVAKGATKVASGAKTGVKTAAKVAIAIHEIPLKLLISFSIRLGKVVCATPEPLLRVSATAAGVTYDVVPLFCKALQTRNMAQVRANLPSIIKLALKLAATTTVPGLAPALAVMKYTPGLSKFAGAPLAASLGCADETYLGDWEEQQLANEIERMSDDDIAGALGVPVEEFDDARPLSNKAGVAVLLGLSAIAIGAGAWGLSKR